MHCVQTARLMCGLCNYGELNCDDADFQPAEPWSDKAVTF